MWKRTDGGTITSGPGCTAAGDRVFCNSFENGGLVTSGANTTYYVGNVEFLVSGTTTTTKRYIGGYLVITTTQVGAGSPSAPSYAYLLRDGLGSIDLVTDQNATVIQRESFDAHGQRRYAAPAGSGFLWNLLPSAQAATFDTSTTRQGYTGHEQLDGVGLVHMNGRLYDQVLGRFIQADPTIEPDATQGLNRYTYVQNNPLSLTDPTGYFSFRQLLGIAIGVVAAVLSGGAATPWLSFLYAVGGGFTSAYIATGSLKAGLWGAFAAGVFWGIGTAFQQIRGPAGSGVFGTGFSGGAYVAKVAAHAGAGGVLSELQGDKFGHGFVSAGATEALSPAVEHIHGAPGQFITTVMIGGTVSAASGGKFGAGATTAAFQYLFNTAIHAVDAQKAAHAMVDADAALRKGGVMGKLYDTEDALAMDWAKAVYPVSQQYGSEIGAKIYRVGNQFEIAPSYSEGAAQEVHIENAMGLGDGTWVATIHTHPNLPYFSGETSWAGWGDRVATRGGWNGLGDLEYSYNNQLDAFVVSPGEVRGWSYSTFFNMAAHRGPTEFGKAVYEVGKW